MITSSVFLELNSKKNGKDKILLKIQIDRFEEKKNNSIKKRTSLSFKFNSL